MRRLTLIGCGLLVFSLAPGCAPLAHAAPPSPTQPTADTASQPAPAASTTKHQDRTKTAGTPTPPAPPVSESFEGKPQLTLFPRVGAYRPEPDQTKQLGFWNTFITHLTRTSGVVLSDKGGSNHVFSLRGVGGINSSGYFSPLAVEPGRSYRLSFRDRGELSADEQAGVGLLEFDQFLWIPGQYTESISKQHLVGRQQLLKLQSSDTWQQQHAIFTCGPKTRMIHLIFYRDGKVNRKPLQLDDIRIEEVK